MIVFTGADTLEPSILLPSPFHEILSVPLLACLDHHAGKLYLQFCLGIADKRPALSTGWGHSYARNR